MFDRSDTLSTSTRPIVWQTGKRFRQLCDADGKKFRQYPQDKQPSLTSSHWSMKKAADWQKSLQSKVVKIKNKDVLLIKIKGYTRCTFSKSYCHNQFNEKKPLKLHERWKLCLPSKYLKFRYLIPFTLAIAYSLYWLINS
jgi:hypothetical protein